MTDYARVDIATLARETDAAPLPQGFVGLAEHGPGSLEDLSWTAPNFADAFVGKGYWPVVESKPTLGPGQRYATPPAYTVNAGPKTVTATYVAEFDPVTGPLVAKAKAEADTAARFQQRLTKALDTLTAKGLIP